MNLARGILVAILTFNPASAMAQDARSLLLPWNLPARAPTETESSILPARPFDIYTDGGPADEAAFIKSLGPYAAPGIGRFNHLTPASVQWGPVPQASRKLLNCIELSTDWDVSQRAVVATMGTQCGISIRIRTTYGFKTPTGKCITTGTIDGVLLPYYGNKKLNWNGSDDRTQIACLGKIEILGITRWRVEDARNARDWLISEARSGQIDEVAIYDTTGNYTALGSGGGKVIDAQSNDLCLLSLTSPDFGSENGSKASKILNIRWTDVVEVRGDGDGRLGDLKFKGSVGREGWSLEFADYKNGRSVSGFDATIAMSTLVEYCRNSDGA